MTETPCPKCGTIMVVFANDVMWHAKPKQEPKRTCETVLRCPECGEFQRIGYGRVNARRERLERIIADVKRIRSRVDVLPPGAALDDQMRDEIDAMLKLIEEDLKA